MKIIVSKEILQNETDTKEKIEKFLKDKTIPEKWAVNLTDGKYVFEYLDSNRVNILGLIDDDYIEMIL